MSENTTQVINEDNDVVQQRIISLCKAMGIDHSQPFFDGLEGTTQKIIDSAKSSVAINDTYGNTLLSIGNNDKVADFTNYNLTNETLNWTLWTAMYNDSWVFKRAIDKPAQDQIRAGISISGTFSKKEDVLRKLKSYRTSLIELIQWGRLYGGSIACMMFDNLKDDDYKTPLQESKIAKSKTMKMYVVDRWYGVDPSYNNTVTKMEDVDFGKPRFYKVTLADGKNITFHHSYVLRYEHRTAPKLIKNGQLQGWGYAEGSHILNELCRDEKLKASIQSLIDKSLIEVIKMSGMRGVFMGTDAANNKQLQQRLEMVNWGRNFNSLTFLDKEDEYIQHTFGGLAGLADLLQQNMWQIAAALEMQGVLFGDLKSGFSNDTEALERYDETINGLNESYLRPIIQKLLGVLYIMLQIDEKIEFEFDSLLKTQHKEHEMEELQKFVELGKSLLDSGVIDLKQFGIGIRNYTERGVIDFGLTDEAIDKLDDKMEEQMEQVTTNLFGPTQGE